MTGPCLSMLPCTARLEEVCLSTGEGDTSMSREGADKFIAANCCVSWHWAEESCNATSETFLQTRRGCKPGRGREDAMKHRTIIGSYSPFYCWIYLTHNTPFIYLVEHLYVNWNERARSLWWCLILHRLSAFIGVWKRAAALVLCALVNCLFGLLGASILMTALISSRRWYWCLMCGTTTRRKDGLFPVFLWEIEATWRDQRLEGMSVVFLY